MNLISIYSYLQERFGIYTQYTGSFFFILSRILGSAARLFLAATVFQIFIFDAWHVPFWATVLFIIFLIWIYTVKGGIKTLIWTDTFQSLMLLAGVIFAIVGIASQMDLGFIDICNIVKQSPSSEIFNWDVNSKLNFWKQFLGGVFIAASMTGLDQNMMQKNLSVKTLKDSQTNIFWFSIIMIFTNIIFLSLGVLLYYYAEKMGISLPLNESGSVFTDRVFPQLALNHLGVIAGTSFIVGLTAATFSSADSVLTTLTTSYYIDFLNQSPDKKDAKLRMLIHLLFALILLFVILIIKALNESAVIDLVLTIAGYTYGPLLGLFFYGLFTKKTIKDTFVPIICLIAPALAYLIDTYLPNIIYNFQHEISLFHFDPSTKSSWFFFGNTILIINGFITFTGLLIFSKKN
jgi:Na+/proline symporter